MGLASLQKSLRKSLLYIKLQQCSSKSDWTLANCERLPRDLMSCSLSEAKIFLT